MTPSQPAAAIGQRGLSLVEIMVAMVISLVLLGGVVQIYVATSQTNRLQQATSRVQENGRFAMQIMAEAIRNAGYVGCRQQARMSGVSTTAVGNPPADYIPTPENTIGGYDNVGATLDTGGNTGTINPQQNTDVLAVRSVEGRSVALTQNNNNGSASFTRVTGNPNAWVAGDLLFVSDCESGDLLQLTNDPTSQSSGVRLTHNQLSREYNTGAAVRQFNRTVYFVRQTGRTASNSNRNIRALYRKVGGNRQELVAGVEDLQITYGIDTNDDEVVDNYRPWSGAADADKVIAIRAQAWVASREDNVLDDAQTRTIAGQTVNDRRLRQLFTTTVLIRNRAI